MTTLRQCAETTRSWWDHATEASRHIALRQCGVITVCPRASYYEFSTWTWDELPEVAREVIVATRFVGLPDSLRGGV